MRGPQAYEYAYLPHVPNRSSVAHLPSNAGPGRKQQARKLHPQRCEQTLLITPNGTPDITGANGRRQERRAKTVRVQNSAHHVSMSEHSSGWPVQRSLTKHTQDAR